MDACTGESSLNSESVCSTDSFKARMESLYADGGLANDDETAEDARSEGARLVGDAGDS